MKSFFNNYERCIFRQCIFKKNISFAFFNLTDNNSNFDFQSNVKKAVDKKCKFHLFWKRYYPGK